MGRQALQRGPIGCPACAMPCAATLAFCPGCGIRLPAQGGTPDAALRVHDPDPNVDRAQAPVDALLNGRYQVVGTLGAGSYGRVYLAGDTLDPGRSLVAIKELLDDQFGSPEDRAEAVDWFKQEVSTLLTLRHPGIPAIHGYWTAAYDRGPYYLAMDYIPGRTLDQVLRESGGQVFWSYAAHWMVALCSAISYLHARTPPVVFRDLKLQNVILDERTKLPVIIDFGIAQHLAPGSVPVGTWGYVPYEQIKGNAEPRSDLYALGALLHALISGRNPEAEYTRLRANGITVAQTLRALFPPLDNLVPGVPSALAQVVARATSFRPEDRFADAAAMARALQQVLGLAPSGALLAPTRTYPAPLPTPVRSGLVAASGARPSARVPARVRPIVLDLAEKSPGIVAAAACVGLLSSFAPWYTITLQSAGGPFTLATSGWHDWGLATTALFVIAAAPTLPAVVRRYPPVAVARRGAITAGAGLLGTLTTLLFMSTEGVRWGGPLDQGPALGAFIGLGCALLVLLGGALMRYQAALHTAMP